CCRRTDPCDEARIRRNHCPSRRFHGPLVIAHFRSAELVSFFHCRRSAASGGPKPVSSPTEAGPDLKSRPLFCSDWNRPGGEVCTAFAGNQRQPAVLPASSRRRRTPTDRRQNERG